MTSAHIGRGVLAAAVLGLAAEAKAGEAASYDPPPAGSVRIVRDTFGIPHVIASTDRDVFFGAGYAQAQDQLENLAKNYLRAKGRISEREGTFEIILDHLVRSLEIPQRAERATAGLDDETRGQLEAFAAGVNRYRQEQRGKLPEWIEPIEPADVVAFALYVDTMFSVSHCRDDLKRAGIQIVGLQPGRALGDDLELGSNQVAIAPARSATGAALLSMDPHLRHSGFFRWYEMHLVSPSLNVMGACFFGLPYVSMGRTAKTAWCMTVNGPDLGDVFVFDVNPDNPDEFRGIDGWTRFEKQEETYRIRTPDGHRQQTQTRLGTALGPVVKVENGKAYVFALPWHESSNRVRQLFDMARAQSLPEFKRALAPLGLVMFNIVYADAAGDIFYISNMRVPRRDLRIDSHALRPGDQPWARWQGYHPLEELPQVENPPCGFLLNCNSGPQNVCFDVAPQPAHFPAYMMSQPANSRSRRLTDLVSQDASIDFDELHRYATDTHLEAADEWVPLITSSLRELAPQYPPHQALLGEVADVLAKWDGRTDLDSRGAILFAGLMRDRPFVEAAQAVDYDAAVAALVRVAGEVRQNFGSLDAPWEQFSRLRRGEHESGVAGCGILEFAPQKFISGAALRPTNGDFRQGRRYCTGGSSYGMLVDFSGPTAAVSCLPFGISEHPESRHFADQMPLYVKGQFKTAWFWPQEIAGNRLSEVTLRVAD